MEKVVISVGGSLLVPANINWQFIKKFCIFLQSMRKTHQFFIVTGGGNTARAYMKAAQKITSLSHSQIDRLGITATQYNAQLLQTVLKDDAYHTIISNPRTKVRTKKLCIIASGWRPGCSSDWDAVLIAKTHGCQTMINMSNVEFVYNANPSTSLTALPFKKISWQEYRSLIPNKWIPGLSTPFDPIASREAQKIGLTVVIMGKSLTNVKCYLNDKKWKGTLIS